MEIRDVIHGAIPIEPRELPVLDSRYFQRLRHIRQLGFGDQSFPSATHTRYSHSLGALHTASRVFETIFASPLVGMGAGELGTTDDGNDSLADRDPGISGAESLPSEGLPSLRERAPEAFRRFRALTRLAALLHDIGHGPLSHTTEIAMPPVEKLAVPSLGGEPAARDRRANHEDYTLKILLDSGLARSLDDAGRSLGFGAREVAALVSKQPYAADFFHERIEGKRVDFLPLLRQVISSELDADRMDYLRRDSLHAGVSYGQFDFDWLIGNLTACIRGGSCFLALQHRGLLAFEDFLISRYHMFLMVYFHYKSVIYDELLARYLADPSCNYRLPSDIERYCERDDADLYSHLASSQNPWARRISDKRPFRMLVEVQNGFPGGAREAESSLDRVESALAEANIPSIVSRSTGELSKSRKGDPLYVRVDNHLDPIRFVLLERCTDLFQRYSEKRWIARIYVEPERIEEARGSAGR